MRARKLRHRVDPLGSLGKRPFHQLRLTVFGLCVAERYVQLLADARRFKPRPLGLALAKLEDCTARDKMTGKCPAVVGIDALRNAIFPNSFKDQGDGIHRVLRLANAGCKPFAGRNVHKPKLDRTGKRQILKSGPVVKRSTVE